MTLSIEARSISRARLTSAAVALVTGTALLSVPEVAFAQLGEGGQAGAASCPDSDPVAGSDCDLQGDPCVYGSVACVCADEHWVCDDAGASGGNFGAGGSGGQSNFRTCSNSEGDWIDLDPESLSIPTAAYSYGDEVSTACLEITTPEEVCLYGLGADSDDGMGETYAHWGSTLALYLVSDGAGGTPVPFDATELGVTQVRYSITGVRPSAPVRFGIGLANTPEVEFESSPFHQGQDSEHDVVEEGTYTVPFAEMKVASWAPYATEPAERIAFDPRNIHSLHFQVVNSPGSAHPYDFCVSDVTWLDENGDEVDVLGWTVASPNTDGGGGTTSSSTSDAGLASGGSGTGSTADGLANAATTGGAGTGGAGGVASPAPEPSRSHRGCSLVVGGSAGSHAVALVSLAVLAFRRRYRYGSDARPPRQV